MVDPILSRAMDRIMMLHADHEQNASTSTVRLASSSGANPFASIAAGIACLWGPAHGGANQACLEMLQTIGTVDRIPEYIARAKDKDDPFRLMGFGHRVYKNFDPRAKVMKQSADEVLGLLGIENNETLKVAKELERIALEDPYFVDKKLYPNVDFYSGIILEAMGFPTSMFTPIFALSRTVGWISQWKEMIADPEQKDRPPAPALHRRAAPRVYRDRGSLIRRAAPRGGVFHGLGSWHADHACYLCRMIQIYLLAAATLAFLLSPVADRAVHGLRARQLPGGAGRPAGAARGLRLRYMGRDLYLAGRDGRLRGVTAQDRHRLAARGLAADAQPWAGRGVAVGGGVRADHRDRVDLLDAGLRHLGADARADGRPLVAASAGRALCRVADSGGACVAWCGAGRLWLACGTSAAVLCILLALGVALAVLWRKPQAPEYGAAVGWALIGIAVDNSGSNGTVMALAIAGLLVVAAMTARGALKGSARAA